MGFNIGVKDIVDIILVAILLYQLFKLLKHTGATNIFLGVLSFLIVWFLVSFVFRLELLGSILDRIVSVGAFGLIVIFQEEVRRFFSRIGSRRHWGSFGFLKRYLNNNNSNKEETDIYLVQIVLACRNMSKTATGALIVLCRDADLNIYTQTGEQINASISSRLIENIFFKNTPLHDGAMIVANKKISAAACILPISKNTTIPQRMGLRHRAAVGITEHTDAIAIVVSEENGEIAWACNGVLTARVKPEQLERFLSEEMSK
jgi:uncharacterized protein (TIGR00159 family)